MDAQSQQTLIEQRLVSAETAIKKLEGALTKAKIYASVFGVAGVTLAVLLQWSFGRLTTLSDRTAVIEKQMNQWDEQVALALDQLEATKNTGLLEVERASQLISTNTTTMLTEMANAQMLRVSKASDSAVKAVNRASEERYLPALEDGSAALRVRQIEIVNGLGRTVAMLGLGKKDVSAEFTISDNNGVTKLRQFVTDGVPYTSYMGASGTKALWLGVYTDTDAGFIDLLDKTGKVKLVSISANESGGSLRLFGGQGKNIVYAGPDSNTGHGLINVMRSKGPGTQSFGIE